jgi:hypothetical protein
MACSLCERASLWIFLARGFGFERSLVSLCRLRGELDGERDFVCSPSPPSLWLFFPGLDIDGTGDTDLRSRLASTGRFEECRLLVGYFSTKSLYIFCMLSVDRPCLDDRSEGKVSFIIMLLSFGERLRCLDIFQAEGRGSLVSFIIMLLSLVFGERLRCGLASFRLEGRGSLVSFIIALLRFVLGERLRCCR